MVDIRTRNDATLGTNAVALSAPQPSPPAPSPAPPQPAALVQRAVPDRLAVLLRKAVLARAPGERTLARTFLDKRDPVAAWKSATSSLFAGRRGKNQPTLLVIDGLLARRAEPGVMDELRFTLRRWLSTYSGSRAAAATALLKELPTGMESVAGPDVEEAEARPAAPAAKYKTYGMMVTGLTKDMNNPLAHSGSESRSLQYRASAHARRYITTVEDGLLKQGGELVNTPRAFIFVMDGQGTIYSASKGEVVHHSSFISGHPAAAAGSFVAKDGVLQSYNGESGHYQPTVEMLAQFKAELESRGVDFSGVELTTKPLTEAQQAGGRRTKNAFHRLGGMHSVDAEGLVPAGHKGGARPERVRGK
ncbi:MAG: hypothetical protein QOI73_112 [Solirubrobacteraceae bacterium]|nr:hypothetical protein [Solirubrobacteraceae bacterium]